MEISTAGIFVGGVLRFFLTEKDVRPALYGQFPEGWNGFPRQGGEEKIDRKKAWSADHAFFVWNFFGSFFVKKEQGKSYQAATMKVCTAQMPSTTMPRAMRYQPKAVKVCFLT